MWIMVHAKQSYLNRDYSVLEQKGRHTIESYFKFKLIIGPTIVWFYHDVWFWHVFAEFWHRLHWLITPIWVAFVMTWYLAFTTSGHTAKAVRPVISGNYIWANLTWGVPPRVPNIMNIKHHVYSYISIQHCMLKHMCYNNWISFTVVLIIFIFYVIATPQYGSMVKIIKE